MASKRPANPSPRAHLPGSDALRPWARELRAACAAVTDDLWDDVGRAVVLLSTDPQRAAAAAHLVAAEAGMNFIAIPEADLAAIPQPETMASCAPALIWLEPGDWLPGRVEGESSEQADYKQGIQGRLAAWVRDFSSSCPLVLVTATGEPNEVSSILAEPGLFDRYLRLPQPSLAQLGAEFIDELGRGVCSKSLRASPAKLGKLVEMEYMVRRRRGMAVLYLRRLVRRAGRPLEFTDLMQLYTHGHIEEGDGPQVRERDRRAAAVHEAGHAVVAILDSKGKNVPDFCSIIPGAGFGGVVVPSLSYQASTDLCETYALFRHGIRIGLAGRAAEELIYGPQGVSNGASGDLENASHRAFAAFAVWGFAPGMTTHDRSASNLFVVVGEPSPSEAARVESLARSFLEEEYRHVYKLVSANRALLDAITDRLMWDPIVDQHELKAIRRDVRSK